MKLLFVGDVATGARLGPVLDAGKNLIVANLEGPVVDGLNACPALRGPYSALPALKQLCGGRLGVASVANNHATDLGEAGLAATCKRLESLGTIVVGTAVGDRGDSVILECGGVRVGFLARVCPRTFGNRTRAADAAALVHLLDPVSLLAAVGTLRAQVDRVVVMIHWGSEWVSVPFPEHVALARSLVLAGAALVIGHHAHVKQAWEVHSTGTIAYGLGTVELRFPDNPHVDARSPRDGMPRPWWAGTSLAVEWDPQTGATNTSTLRWDAERLTPSHQPRLPRASHAYLRSVDVKLFARLARRDYYAAKLRTAWQARILPRPSHLRSILSIFREARPTSTE